MDPQALDVVRGNFPHLDMLGVSFILWDVLAANILKSIFLRRLRTGFDHSSLCTSPRVRKPVLCKDDPRHLLNVPVDVMLEVIAPLHPLDLFHLCMTCKGFRQFLLSKDGNLGQAVQRRWEESLDTSGLPPPPESVTAQDWVVFLFERPRCQVSCSYPKI